MSNAIVIIAILSVVFVASLGMVLMYAAGKGRKKNIVMDGRAKVGRNGLDAEISIDVNDNKNIKQKSKSQEK